jgi:plasmid stabilization system protein ParE
VPERYQVRWSPVAVADTLSILDYIAQENPGHAEQLFDKIRARAKSLERLPERGRVVPELQAIGVRFLREQVLAPYRILYRIEGNAVHVVAVFDGRRNLEDILLDRALRND